MMMEEETAQEQQNVTQQANPMQRPQRRIAATSVHGDTVWQTCQPVLEWLIANGDKEAQARAIQTRAYWEANQGWLIDSLNKNGFFELVARAMQDPKSFRKVLATLPPATRLQVDFYVEGQEEPRKVDAVAYLALKAAERMNERHRIRCRRIGKRGKRHGK